MHRVNLRSARRRDNLPRPALGSGSGFSAFMDLNLAACAVLRSPDDLPRLVRMAT